jgi:hypothetical protein
MASEDAESGFSGLREMVRCIAIGGNIRVLVVMEKPSQHLLESMDEVRFNVSCGTRFMRIPPYLASTPVLVADD